MLEPYLLERKKHTKWYMKLFKRFLNYSINNCRIMVEKSQGSKKHHLTFRLELVEQILARHLKNSRKRPANLGDLNFAQEVSKHTPKLLPPNGQDGKKSRTLRRRCIWCSNKKIVSRTTHVCNACNVPLCLDPCFRLYHSE